MVRWVLGLCILAGIGAGLLLGALNPDPIALDLGVWQLRAPLGAVVAAAALAGALGGLLLALLLRLVRPRNKSASQASMIRRDG